MAQSFNVYPSGDIANDGWTLVASTYTKIWEILSAVDDNCHIRCPSYRGGAEVSFPVDVSNLPAGAIIDSVTIFIRMKTNAGSGPRSVTANVLSSENRSRYTTRTIFATSSIQTFEVGTYTKDPLGKAWDVHRLNKLRMRLFSYNNLFDSIRIYGLWCRVNYHVRPTVTISSPTGTVNTPSPTVTWDYTQAEGEPQKSAEYKIFTMAQTNVSAFNPDTSDPVYATVVDGEAESYVLPTSLNNDTYKVYVRVQSQFGSWSDWVNRQFSVLAPSPGVPGDDNAGIAGIPGVGVPTVVPDNYTSSASIRMLDTSNLLSVQQADFEIASDPLGYVASPGSTTIARDTLQSFGASTASLKITSGAAGTTMSAASTKVEVAPDSPMTVRCQFLADPSAASGRSVSITAQFYDQDYTLLGGAITGTGTDSSSTWTEVVGTGTSPSLAKYCEVVATITTPALSESHYIDHVGLMYGTDTAWSDGGHTSRNMLTSFLATGDDPAPSSDAWVATNAATTLSRVSATGTGAHGLKCNQMTAVSVSPSIAPRAVGSTTNSTIFTSSTTGTNFTLYKPTQLNGSAATVQDNDLLIAFVTSTEFGTITPPSGWTAVNTAAVDDGSTDIALWVLKRTALAADPASWTTGTVSTSSSRRTAVVMAYSGAAVAEDQFIAEGVRTETSEPLVHQTATVVNTDPNAWRISAFAASDDHTGMSMTANITPPSTPPAIQYVGKATAWQQTSDTLSYTLNKPSGVQSGDLLVAAAVFSGNTTTITPPSGGWVLVRRQYRASSGDDDWHSGDVTVAIFKKTAGGSEPTSWTGTHTDYGRPKITQVVAYRNCDDASNQFIAETANGSANGSSVSTGTVNNTNSKAWRITMFAGTTNYGRSWSTGDTVERSDDSTNYSNFPDTSLSIQDSNGTIGTGNHSRSASISSGSYFAAVGWIGIIKPLASPPAAGANETSRVGTNGNLNGSANPWLETAVFDSNGVIPTGATSVYGQLTTSDGLGSNSMASWIGIIKPAASVQGGTVATNPNVKIDIDNVPDEILDLAGNKLTIMSDFKGSTAGTPVLAVKFYRANQLIGRQQAAGRAFDSSSWTKSWAVFDIPTGTTRILPELSALDRSVGDTVGFDRVAVMLGALDDVTQEPQWRNGTARPEHPVWSKPILQYQENDGTGYGPWIDLPGQKARPPAFNLADGRMTYVDHTIIPLNARRYRVSTLSYGLNGDFFSSGYGPASQEAIFEPNAWWLKDIQDLSKNISIAVKWKDQTVTTTNTATAFQPLGEQFPVVVTEGFKGDIFSLEIHCEQSEFTALMSLLNSGRTLILQSDIDKMWWVRPVGDIQANVLATASRQTRPRRYVTVNFVQVAPVE